jgi:nicotinate-nucleotide pyrophosphorylase (carboxylating)
MMNYEQQLSTLIANALAEDIGDGDHSTLSSISPLANGKAVLKIKEDGVLAGVAVAEKIYFRPISKMAKRWYLEKPHLQ